MSDPNKTPARPTQPESAHSAPTTPFVPPTPVTPLPSSSILSSFSTPQQVSDRIAKIDAKAAKIVTTNTETETTETKLFPIAESNSESNVESHMENEFDTHTTSENDTHQNAAQNEHSDAHHEHSHQNASTVDDLRRQFDYHMIQAQNEKQALQNQLYEMNARLAQAQYEQSFYRYNGNNGGEKKFDVSKSVAKPDGFTGDFKSDPDTWIATMRNYLLLTNTPSNIQAHIAGTYLKGAAAQWYNTLSMQDRSSLVDFEAFAKMLLTRFRPLDVVGQARRRLARITQTGSVEAFNQQFMQLMQLIPTMNEEERIESYRSKLKFELKKQLVTQEYYRLSDIMNVALRTDALLYENNMIGQRPSQFGGPRNPNRPYNGGKQRTEQGGATAAAIGVNNVKVDSSDAQNDYENQSQDQQLAFNYVAPRPMDEAERQRCRDNRLCFRCRQPGHRSVNCTVFTSSNQRPGLKPSSDISSKKY